MDAKRVLAVVISMVFIGVAQSSDLRRGASAYFVADAQIHNVQGSSIKQMLRISDLATKVAQRPPELNLLAQYVLEDLLQKGLADPPLDGDDSLVFMLGDATNIGCTGEQRRFYSAIQTSISNGHIVLMAHGNHDSYLMGTANNYLPGSGIEDWKPVDPVNAKLPVDETWWGVQTQPLSQNSNDWKHACYEQGRDSEPVNKIQWMARYMEMLKGYGVDFVPIKSDKNINFFRSVVSQGVPLAEKNYVAEGRYVPRVVNEPNVRRAGLTRTYESFMVQAVNVGVRQRLIIIDTSVCEAAGGWGFVFNNAGQHGCIGREQMKSIRSLAHNVPKGWRIVFAGHFPLRELKHVDRVAIESVMLSFSDHPVYISAHTHDPMSITRREGVTEINIGSTTDWPMEGNWISFRGGDVLPAVFNHVVDTESSFSYSPPEPYQGSELCRHLAAAEGLAKMSVDATTSRWRSPGTARVYYECERGRWEDNAERINAALSTIDQRMNDSEFRRVALRIAAAASRQEYLKNKRRFIP